MLAASGMPSKMIAARLWLSTRTVNNHLAHVYALLGVWAIAATIVAFTLYVRRDVFG